MTATDTLSTRSDTREARLSVDLDDLTKLVADRDQLFMLTAQLAEELNDLASHMCWCRAGFDGCRSEHCTRRRELIAAAHAAITGGVR